jgi:hypothetical protein
VGINNFKALRNGKILIETNTKEEMETLGKDINTKCGDKLETHIHKLRNPGLAVFNIPDDINTDNFEDALMAQNPDVNLAKGDIKAKFTYETKKHTRNLSRGGRGTDKKAAASNENKTRVANLQYGGLRGCKQVLQMLQIQPQAQRSPREGNMPTLRGKTQSEGVFGSPVGTQMY